MAYLITIPKEHKQEITQILRTTASLKDAKLDLLSCGTLGDDVDLLIDTDLDGWDVDGILEAHLDGAGYSFANQGYRYVIGEKYQELTVPTAAQAHAKALATLNRQAIRSFIHGGKAK
jgi:5S rRNA maturation endonuclease (ribonuclease M5)